MSAPHGEAHPQPTALTVEYEMAPTNVDPTDPPRFSWQISTDRRGSAQTAYRLVVGRDRGSVADGRGELWDSGVVESNASTNVTYRGPKLGSDVRYYWSVKVWMDDEESEWADPETFTTALAPDDWRGEWITHQPSMGDTNGWRSRWRAPDEGGEEWVQVDLGEEHLIETIKIHGAEPIDVVRTPDDTAVTISWAENPLTGFGFPDEYRVEVSSDPEFVESTVIASVETERKATEPDGVPTDEVPVQSFETVDVDGRYVRITATDCCTVTPATSGSSHIRSEDRRVEDVGAWECFALAALTVLDGDGRDLAADASVSSSSSVETDTWGHEHLVNGRTTSRTGTTSPLLRTEFDLGKSVSTARLHVAAVGYGEVYVNGERLGERRLDPAWTDYERRVLYSSYDVGGNLDRGSNAFGLWLGRGWFSRSSTYWTNHGSPRVRAQLIVEFEDGTTRTIKTDESWTATASPLLDNDIYDGEVFDARKAERGWGEPRFDSSFWDGAAVVDGPDGVLRPERIEPMEIVETIDVSDVRNHPEGPILDFGQNLTGWIDLEIDNPMAGDEITIRHAEALTDDGNLSTIDLRTADATDTYIARGEDVETYEPRFTYHGFRYAQISGYPGELDPSAVTAKVVHTGMDRRGTFECSDDELNDVQHNAVWGLMSNTHSIPEDCPQRDERFGWTGDAHISTRALLFNFDGVRFDEKWLRDHDDVASEMGYVPDVIPNMAREDPADPTWSITRVMLPWYLYQHDGDRGVIHEQYEGMREYVDYWHSVTEDGILPDEYGKFGDWLAFENTDGRRGLPHDFYNTAFHYQVTETFAKIADVLNNETDAREYRNRARTVKEAFNDEYYDAGTGTYAPETQSSLAVPLFLGMVPEADSERVAETLAEKVRSDGGKLKTGFLGTRPMIHTLAEHGYEDLAYEIVSQPERPGWVYMVRQGATTMWERWNSDESVGSGMNSLNHSPFTHVSEFFYEVLAGIKAGDMPLTDHVTIAPSMVEDLEWVEARLDTRNGELAVEWERSEESYELSVTVPWNVEATIRLPEAAGGTLIESGARLDETLPAGIRSVESDGEDMLVAVGSGRYEFTSQ